MQLSDDMGDARHKKPPTTEDPEEPVTAEFRETVRMRLAANKLRNQEDGLRSRDPSRRIDDYASLARAVGTDTKQISNILGPVRPTSKVKLVESSTFLRRIRRVLDLEPATMMAVPNDLVPLVKAWGDLSDESRRMILGGLQAITDVKGMLGSAR